MPTSGEKKRSVRGEPKLWLAPAGSEQPELPHVFSYRPAVMVECLVEFRDVRAEVIHAKEAFYTAWLPEGDDDLAVDWSVPAAKLVDSTRLEPQPRTDIQPYQGRVRLTKRRMDEAQADLVDFLVRRESLTLFYNPYLKWYSKLGEGQSEFLHRVKEEAITRLQPQLKELARRLALQLEQLRELPLSEDVAPESAGELEAARRRMIGAIQNKMDALIMGNPGAPAKPLLDVKEEIPTPDQIKGLKEELGRIEQDVLKDLNALLTQYRSQAHECQEYTIRLQPTDIKIIRRALLWVPVLA
jgi:hypothetical protein